MNTTRKPSVRQSDIRRMMRAVQAEGLYPRTVRVATTGDVSIDVGEDIEVQADPLDAWRDQRGSSFPRH